MPSIRYVNQTAPFWDFIASLENQGSQHPFFNRGESDDEAGPSWGPWGPWGGRRWHHGPMPHHPHHHRGPPPGPPPHGHPGEHPPTGPPPEYDPEASPDTLMGDTDEKRGATEKDNTDAGPSTTKEKEHEGREGCRRRTGGRCHGRSGFGARRGPWWRHGGPPPGGFPFMFGGLNQGPGGKAWGDFLRDQIFGEAGNATNKEGGEQADFKPELDVFDTETAYVIHVSLPGAKKEDVGVNWDPEKSELAVAGVIYRPGDEELLKNLAMDGRKVGPFENKVRLGSRANPAQVDPDAITAKLEDGILIIEVPKLDKDYVEIKKVDIE